MGKTRAASHDQQAASQDLISESAMNQIWSHFETKLNDWISNTLPRLTKDLIMSYGRSAVDEYVSSTQFKKSLPGTPTVRGWEFTGNFKIFERNNRRSGGSECHATRTTT